ncbi:MAG: hypothetical protein EBX36_08840, partial [Planctomycetia bacterium]|nr:hypothetical protein [Planctomycetia bacterium]
MPATIGGAGSAEAAHWSGGGAGTAAGANACGDGADGGSIGEGGGADAANVGGAAVMADGPGRPGGGTSVNDQTAA